MARGEGVFIRDNMSVCPVLGAYICILFTSRLHCTYGYYPRDIPKVTYILYFEAHVHILFIEYSVILSTYV